MKPDIFYLHILYIISWSQKDMRYSLQGVCHDAVGVYFFPCKVCVMKPKASSSYNPHGVS